MWVCKEWDPKVIMGLLISFAIFVVVVVVALFFLACIWLRGILFWGEELGS